MSKYGVFSGPYFFVFSPNTGKYGPENTPYLDTFHAVYRSEKNWYKPERILKIINKKYTESKQSIISFKMSEYVLKVYQLLIPKNT